METNAFASLSVLALPSPYQLLRSSCCPDKDLVVLVSRQGGKDRISLWKMQGPLRIWETSVGLDDNTTEEVAELAWSPDGMAVFTGAELTERDLGVGQSIAVAHEPSCITIHSVQDGHQERVLELHTLSQLHTRPHHITGIWWFLKDRPPNRSPIPDIFRRGNTITGSAHSILKMLPRLDQLQEDTQKLTATDIFAFQGSQTRPSPKCSQPDFIKYWPTLQSDPLTSSLGFSLTGTMRSSSNDDRDDSNSESLLVVAVDSGHLHTFLEGSYPLGSISIEADVGVRSMFKHHGQWSFDVCLERTTKDARYTDVLPTKITIPSLDDRKVQDYARSSTTALELVWYIIRVVKEMRNAWFGSESFSGARELGPRWIRALEAKQINDFGEKEPNAIFDLTRLLLTGRSTDALSDLLGSGEQMSERGIQKWESTVTEALMKLRDFSEKRVVPACQRLFLVMEEVLGWSRLPLFSMFDISSDEVSACREHISRAIIISSWLASAARRELCRFKEFISWLRFEVSAANPSNDSSPSSRYDILEVNHYFMSGLVVSSIDKWFIGSIPHFHPFGFANSSQPLHDVLSRVKQVIGDPAQMAWQENVSQRDLSHIDRNLDALVQELAMRCQRIFVRGSVAASRTACVRHLDVISRTKSTDLSVNIREHTIKKDGIIQYLAMFTEVDNRSLLCMARLLEQGSMQLAVQLEVALLECCLLEEGQEGGLLDLDLLEAEFFDNECVVIVYRFRNQASSTFIATVSYNDLGYQKLHPEGYITMNAREDLMLGVIEAWGSGRLSSVRVPIKRCRQLALHGSGGVSLAVNGRIGRRVACVLDERGTTMESLDLEGDGDGMETDAMVEGEGSTEGN